MPKKAEGDINLIDCQSGIFIHAITLASLIVLLNNLLKKFITHINQFYRFRLE